MKPQYPLVFSSLLMRLGVGIMVTHIVMSLTSSPLIPDERIALFSMGAVVLGVLLSMTHLGRPKRFFHAFYNPSSLLTWEAIVTPLLLAFMVVLALGSYKGDGVVLTGIGKAGTVVFGVLLIYVTAKVYHLKARPSWASPMVVYEFFLSAICMGVLGYAGIMSVIGQGVTVGLYSLSWLALMLLAAEFGVTIYYLNYVKGVSRTASDVLQERTTLVHYYVWMFLGLALPFMLSAVTLATHTIYRPMVWLPFLSFFVGALSWRILFFKIATPIKITPDIEVP